MLGLLWLVSVDLDKGEVMRVVLHVFLTLMCMVGLFVVACFIGDHGDPWWRVLGTLVVSWSMWCVWLSAVPDMKKLVDAIRNLR